VNRRIIVIAIAAGALTAFALAAYFYRGSGGDAPADLPAVEAPVAAASDAAAAIESAANGGAASAAPEPEAADAPAPAPRWTTYVREHSPVIGPVDARVTIVEFFDPACEACRAFYPIVHQILARHPRDVRLVLRYTPLHDGSEAAVRILETARLQNEFEPVLTALFEQQPQWAAHGAPRLDLAWNAAASAGLDVNAARAAMNGRRINAALRQDMTDAGTLNVRGTPTFFVNERLLTNFGPQQLYDLVLSELAATE